ncbi:MAG: hypothetical protein WA484_01230 [Solirubrobacteraceae bacterium]
MYAGSFGPGGLGVGTFANPQGVAVDQATGEVYVYDNSLASEGAIYKFNSTGEPVDFTGGSNVISKVGYAGGEAENELVFDNSAGPGKGDLYIATSHNVGVYNSETGVKLEELTREVTGLGLNAPWGEPCGVAVDRAGNVYVGLASGHVNKYTPATNPVKNTDYKSSLSGLTGETCNVAVDTEENVYAITWKGQGGGPVIKYAKSQFNTGGIPAGGGVEVNNNGSTLAVNLGLGLETGDLFVDEREGISQYNSFGSQLDQFANTGLGALKGSFGVAIDGETGKEALYAGNSSTGLVNTYGPLVVVPDVVSTAASNVGQGSMTANGTVNPDGIPITSCRFEYGTSMSYGTSVPCLQTPAEIGVGGSKCVPPGGPECSPVPVSATIPGLSPNTSYHFRLVAGNANGVSYGGDQEATTLSAPIIDSQRVLSVGATGATLSGLINPENFDTIYHFEYVTDAQFQSDGFSSATVVPQPDVDIGSGGVDRSVGIELANLQSDTVYHFRVVAHSIQGTTPGPDHVFRTTVPVAGLALPDGRAYELVSPVDKNGGEINGGTYLNVSIPEQASLDGGAVTYGSSTGFAGAQSQLLTDQYLSTRGVQGWSTRAITPVEDVTMLPSGGASNNAGSVTDDAYQGFSEDLAYGFLQSGDPAPVAAPKGYWNPYWHDLLGGGYQLLETVAPPVQPPGAGDVAIPGLITKYAGSTPDGSHVIFAANDALTPDGVPGAVNLYEWGMASLQLVSVLPGGSPDAGTQGLNGPQAPLFGSGLPSANSPEEVLTRDPQRSFTHAISEDGSRVFWTGSDENVYMSEVGVRTVQVDAAVGGHGIFSTASSDGSKVFFTTGTNTEQHGRLEEYDVNSGQTFDLTPGLGGPNGVQVVKGVLGASEDGSYVYYAVADYGNAEAPGDIYVYHDGLSVLVAPKVNSVSDWEQHNLERSSRVSPNGLYLAFQSSSSLTGYDNVPVNRSDCSESGNDAPCSEVYFYDAVSGKLGCASCNPSGATPVGQSEIPQTEPLTSLGTNPPPGGLIYKGWVTPSYQARYLLDNGELFFDSGDNLVPRATNGKLNVYEYENGQVSLISTGTSSEDSLFFDASADGRDVFFTTTEQLVRVDKDNLRDLYDARVGGGIASQNAVPPAECQGAACQIPVGLPSDLTPGTLTLSAPGNLTLVSPVVLGLKSKPKVKRCRNGTVRKVSKCVKKRRARAKKSGARRIHRGAVRGGGVK